MSRNSLAHMELSRALSASGAARIEGLVKLSQREPQFAPVWGALAEEHWRARRREEALQAARRALRIDPGLHKRFTRELSMATRHILAEVEAASPAMPPPASPAPAQAAQAAQQAARPAGPPSQAARELEQAASLVGYRRRNRLEELSVEYPDHGPIWLALAEENLAQRSVNHALDALDRALELDPTLLNLISPELERARKYTRREPLYRDEPGPESRPAVAPSRPSTPEPPPASESAPSASASAPSPSAPSPSLPSPAPASSTSGMSPMATGGEAAPMLFVGAQAAVQAEPEPAASSPLVTKMLATALALRDRGERIAVLQELATAAPEDTNVLFHLAQELALDGRTEEARDVGNQLRQLSPQRYADLYAWAEQNLTAQAKSESDLTRVLRILDSEPAPARPAAEWELIEDEDDVATMKMKDRARRQAAMEAAMHHLDMDDEVTTRADVDSFRSRQGDHAAMGAELGHASAGAGVDAELGHEMGPGRGADLGAGPGAAFESEEEVTMKVSGKELMSPAFKTDRMDVAIEAGGAGGAIGAGGAGGVPGVPEASGEAGRMGYERADSEFTTRPLWVSGDDAAHQDTPFEPAAVSGAPAPVERTPAEPAPAPVERTPAPQPLAQPGRRQFTPSKHVIRRTSLSSKKNMQGAAPQKRRSPPAKPDPE